jgi:hypothetical protein
MKQKRLSTQVLNAYDEGYKTGIDIALANEKLKINNPYNPFCNRGCWEGFSNGIKDGYMQGCKQREQQRAYQRLKELSKLSASKANNREPMR